MRDHRQAGKPSWYVSSHPGQLSLAIPPWVGAMSTSESSGVNMHTARCTSRAPCTVLQCKLVSDWVLRKRRSPSPHGRCGSGRTLHLHINVMFRLQCGADSGVSERVVWSGRGWADVELSGRRAAANALPRPVDVDDCVRPSPAAALLHAATTSTLPRRWTTGRWQRSLATRHWGEFSELWLIRPFAVSPLTIRPLALSPPGLFAPVRGIIAIRRQKFYAYNLLFILFQGFRFRLRLYKERQLYSRIIKVSRLGAA